MAALPPPPGDASGGVVLVVVQVIVEADDGADELSQLHEVSRDDVDAVLPGPLRSDPLHHAGQGPGRTNRGKARKRRVLHRGPPTQLETRVMQRVHTSCEHDTQTGPRAAALQLTGRATEGIPKDV